MLKVKKEELIQGFSIVDRVIKLTPTMPILSNVFVSKDKDKGVLIATDLEVGIKYYFDFEGEIEDFIVPSRTFENLIRTLPDEYIEITKKESYIFINSDGKTYKIRTIDDEYPFISISDVDKEIYIKKEILKNGIKKTSFSVSDPQKGRIEFASLLTEIKGNDIKMVSTDGNRLSIFKTSDFKKEESDFYFLIPKNCTQVLDKILSTEEKDTIKFGFSNKSFYYEGEKIYLISRLGQGNFPNYEIVLPKKEDNYVLIDRNILIESLTRLLLITREGSGKVVFDFNDNLLTLKGSSIDVGEGSEEINIKEGKIENNKIILDNRKILEGLKAMSEDIVKLIVVDSESPVTCKDGDNYLYIIMPYRSE